MLKLKNYFEEKIGESLHENYTTGERFFTETYKRQYSLEVIDVKDGKVYLQVESFDITPSGMRKVNTHLDFGTCEILLENFETPKEIKDEVCRLVNPDFFSKYNL